MAAPWRIQGVGRPQPAPGGFGSASRGPDEQEEAAPLARATSVEATAAVLSMGVLADDDSAASPMAMRPRLHPRCRSSALSPTPQPAPGGFGSASRGPDEQEGAAPLARATSVEATAAVLS